MRVRSLSIVVPVYNSEATLAELVDGVRQVCTAEAIPYEILLVNDGSRDGSWDVIQRLSCLLDEVRGLDLARNFGQHNALLCGVRAARHEVIVTLDDDLQHPPDEIPRLLRKLENGFDVVYGISEQQTHGTWRGAASRLTKWMLARLTGDRRGHDVSAFRAFRTDLRNAFCDYRSPQALLDVLLTWGTTRITAVTVSHRPRRVGVSNYTFTRLVAHAVNLLTGFSTLPMQLAIWLGFGCTLFGMAILAWVIGSYAIRGTTQPGFPFLASIITIFAGAQLFSIGILGAYLSRVHLRLMDMPQYVVRQRAEPLSANMEKAA